jgi:hypothetical protein
MSDITVSSSSIINGPAEKGWNTLSSKIARNPYASVTFTVDNESIKVPSEKNENGHSEFSITTDYFNITIPKGSMVEDWGLIQYIHMV